MMNRFWVGLGKNVVRLPVALALTIASVALLFLQARYLDGHMKIKVEASDLLPAGHPRTTEFNFIRDTFKGSSRGFFVAVEAPVARLREVVPPIAARFGTGLPKVDFVRFGLERQFFEDHLLLFQSLEHLRKQAAYLKEYRADVDRLMRNAGSLSEMADAISDIVDGEQDLSSPTDEAAKDKKLAKDVESLAPFLTMVRRALAQAGAGHQVDPHYVDSGVQDLLLRGWFDAQDLSRLNRELFLPEDVWEKPGPTLAIIWIATQTSDFDADFSGEFMRRAEAIRTELALTYPGVTLRFTGGIASYNAYQKTVLADFGAANLFGLLSVLLLLVVGFRALTPFALLMLFLTSGTMGTLVMQNFLFDGVNMIATAAALAVIGIGSDYGVIFLTAYQQELGRYTPPSTGGPSRKERLRSVRRAMKKALASIGTATTVGCVTSAAAFLALSGADLVPLARRLVGLDPGVPKGFQPIRELGVGGAVGLLYCLVLMLVALPAALYLVEWVKGTRGYQRLVKLTRPLRRRAGKQRRWLIWKGRVRTALRTDYERQWFRVFTESLLPRRLWVIGLSTVLCGVALYYASRVGWATGQKEVEPRHSEAVEVSERVEHRFGRSNENLLVYGSLDAVRRFHQKIEQLRHVPGTNVGEVVSIDDYLPPAGESQEDKIALAGEMDATLRGIRPALPRSELLVTGPEIAGLRAAAQAVGLRLLGLAADPRTMSAFRTAAARLAELDAALALAEPLLPASDWRDELVLEAAPALAHAREECGRDAGVWFEAQAAQGRIGELKQLCAELDALLGTAGADSPAFLRRDLTAAALALGRLGEAQLGGGCQEPGSCGRGALADAAALLIEAANGPAPQGVVALSRVARDRLLEPALWLGKLTQDAGLYALALEDPSALDEPLAQLERLTHLFAARMRPTRLEVGSARDRLLAASYRLRRSIETLSSFAAANGFASVAPQVPATLAALDGVIAAVYDLPAARAEGIVRDFDDLFARRVFSRFDVVRRAAALTRHPLTLADVPEQARRLFSGTTKDGEELYLARVLPKVSMLQRAPYEQIERAVSRTLDEVHPVGRHGYSGFEALLNLATDYLESTFTAAMVSVTAFVLLVLFLLNRSWMAVAVTLSPVVIGTLLTLAMMSILGMRISIFTVIAIPVLVGVAADSSIQVFRAYTAKLAAVGRVSIPDVMAEVGKVVTLNSFSTVLPFGVLMFGDMKGLVALGTILAVGVLFCFIAKIIVLPCLLSVVHDWIVPSVQYAVDLWPRRWYVRVLRAIMGRWLELVPRPDPGISAETTAGGVVVVTVRRPPLNLMDAAMAASATESIRAFLRDPQLGAYIARSGLPRYYQVRDARGQLLLDAKGKPKRIAATRMEADELPPGYTREGPMRTFGGGADLSQAAQNPLMAFFMLEGAQELSSQYWYAQRPIIFIAEGDMVAGWFELAMYTNFFLVTKHARLGAPEVKRGLTLPTGSHALHFRAGTSVAQGLMASGEFISGEEAVRLGIADGLVPDGVDPLDHALALCRTAEFQDRIRQVSMLRQYGPPMKQLLAKSVRNYVNLLRDKDTRNRLRSFLSRDLD